MASSCYLCGAGPQAAVEILVELGLRIRTKHTNHQGGKQMTKTTAQRTRSLRTIAAPLIAIVLVMTARLRNPASPTHSVAETVDPICDGRFPPGSVHPHDGFGRANIFVAEVAR